MLRMCRPIFVSGEDVVLDSGFCVVKGITDIKAKGVHEAALIKKRRYWLKLVPGDLIYTQSEYKEVGDVGMIEERTEYIKLFKMLSIKAQDYVIKIMESWMKPDELDGENKRSGFMEISGTKETEQLTYYYTFGINFRYRHQLDHHNNMRHAPISLERTW